MDGKLVPEEEIFESWVMSVHLDATAATLSEGQAAASIRSSSLQEPSPRALQHSVCMGELSEHLRSSFDHDENQIVVQISFLNRHPNKNENVSSFNSS